MLDHMIKLYHILSYDKTTHRVLDSGFYCPTFFEDARRYAHSCHSCQ